MKYKEQETLDEVIEFINSTYTSHYAAEDQHGQDVQLIDAWIALGLARDAIRANAIGYLWRYGKKAGNNRKDLMKTIHLLTILMHLDEKQSSMEDVDK